MLTPYPQTLNMEALAIFGKAAALLAQGKMSEIDSNQALHAAWEVQGYGMNVWKPDPVKFGAVPPLTAGDIAAVAKQCEETCAAQAAGTMSAAPLGIFPWGTAISVAMAIIQWYLSHQK